MKPATSEVQVTSTLASGRRGSLSLDENSLVHIMDTLTNIYSDAEMAVIREYPSNAWDSHRKAGITRPIEVTLPNEFDSVFKVRDFGVGLDADDVFEIYGKYGLSTKRDSNDEIGMLGIGCKAALTYVDQFTLRCVKDGQRIIATISTPSGDADDENIFVSDPVETDESNGVEVSVAVINPRSFNRKAHEFFAYWNADDVRINGDPPIALEGQWIDDNVLIRPFNYGSGLYHDDNVIVMGGVPYPVGRPIFGETTFVAFVPIGSVDPTPSRESLKDTERTEETVDAAKRFVRDRLFQLRQDALDACEHPHEARELIQEWEPAPLQQRDLRYRGRRIMGSLRAKGFEYNARGGVNRYNPSGRSSKSYWTPMLTHLHGLAIITGFPNKTVHPRHRERIDRYFDDRPHDNNRKVILVQSLAHVEGLEWMNPDLVTVVDWEDVAGIELPKSPKQPQGEVKFMVYHAGMSHPTTYSYGRLALVAESHDLFYITPSDEDAYFDGAHAAKLLGHNSAVARIGKNQVRKFQRTFPNARSAVTAVAELGHVVSTSLSPIEAASATGHLRSTARGVPEVFVLDPADVFDPDLKALLKEVDDIDDEKVRLWDQIQRGTSYLFRLHHGIGGQLQHKDEIIRIRRQMGEVADRYPFIARIHSPDPSDLLEYVNAVYIYRTEA